MIPLKVTAELASPLVGEPMLDSIVECVLALHMSSIMQSSNGHRHCVEVRGRGQSVSEPGKIPIPILRRQVGRWPIPLSSSPIFSAPHFDGVEYVGKALALEYAGLLRPSERKIVSTTGSWTKSYRLPLRVRNVDRVVWFCAVKSCDNASQRTCFVRELRKLLRRVHSIGKKTADGYGRVVAWHAEQIEVDLSWFAPPPNGSQSGPVLMRPLPACYDLPENLAGSRRSFGAPCPPYWQRSLYGEIVTPC